MGVALPADSNVAVSRGLVNGAPCFPNTAPASRSNPGSRSFPVVVLLAVVLRGVSSGDALGGHRAVAREKT